MCWNTKGCNVGFVDNVKGLHPSWGCVLPPRAPKWVPALWFGSEWPCMVFDNEITLFHFFFKKKKIANPLSEIPRPQLEIFDYKWKFSRSDMQTGRLDVQRWVHPTAFFPVPRIMRPSPSCGAPGGALCIMFKNHVHSWPLLKTP